MKEYPCYDIPRMLRELADEIEADTDGQNQITLVLQRWTLEHPEKDTFVHGIGRFMNSYRAAQMMASGLNELLVELDSDQPAEDDNDYV